MYVQQASEFYDAAAGAKPNTAPLIYYYSFLNLAKALCEFHNPQFHTRHECYAHGLSWRPNPKSVVDFFKETVTIRGRGIWHVLWEIMTKLSFPAGSANLQIPVRKLFLYCPEISAECGRLFSDSIPKVDLHEPEVVVDPKRRETWLRFSIERGELRAYHHISTPDFISQIRTPRSGYLEVKSKKKEMRTFQSEKPQNFAHSDPSTAMESDILGLNLIAHLGDDQRLRYSTALQKSLPIRLPQLVVSYTILFWLGSLVRYDPHSVYDLIDSPVWILIDGFMSQTRLWLLELFQWALFRTETTLVGAR